MLAADHSPRCSHKAGTEVTVTTRWRPEFDPNHLYFVTTATVNHAHILKRDVVKRIVVDSLYFIPIMNGARLYAFVVMPNHIHVILQCPEQFPLSDWARSFKTSTSQLIIRHYETEGNQQALAILAASVTRAGKQRYKVWEDGYLAKAVVSPDFLTQKLEYIHNNPVQPHWGLADAPLSYVWSSAGYYLGVPPTCLIPIEDVRRLLV